MLAVEVPEAALVIRFAPWTATNVLNRAGLAYRRRGEYTASVFADLKADTESDDDLVRRLYVAAGLHGIDPEQNAKYDRCALAAELLELGFMFMKDEDEDEAAEHYSVRLGDSPTLEDVERFLSVFTRERRPQ